MFQSLYDSPWVATFLVGAISALGFALWLRRRSFLVAFFGLFTLVAVGDALRSGTWSPLHLLSSSWEDPIGMAFVLAGDFRYFLLVDRFAWRPDTKARDATAPKAWLTAIAWMAIAPLVSLALMKVWPKPFAETRWSYLIYEVVAVTVVLALRFRVLPRRLAAAPAAVRKWLLDVTHFELGLYSLWLLSDVIILALGWDAAFLLRIVPNIMYYGLFLPFVAFRAPPDVDR